MEIQRDLKSGIFLVFVEKCLDEKVLDPSIPRQRDEINISKNTLVHASKYSARMSCEISHLTATIDPGPLHRNRQTIDKLEPRLHSLMESAIDSIKSES